MVILFLHFSILFYKAMRDITFEQARKRIFTTDFFRKNLPFKNYTEKVTLPEPAFLDLPDDLVVTTDYWSKRFYNRMMRIDFDQTILVIGNTYDYYKNLPDMYKFYIESRVPADNYRNSWGIKFRKQY